MIEPETSKVTSWPSPVFFFSRKGEELPRRLPIVGSITFECHAFSSEENAEEWQTIDSDEDLVLNPADTDKATIGVMDVMLLGCTTLVSLDPHVDTRVYRIDEVVQFLKARVAKQSGQ